MLRQQPPTRIEQEYAAAILRLVVAGVRAALGPLDEALPELLASAAKARAQALRGDADEGKKIRKLIEKARGEASDAITTKDLEKLARKFAERTSSFQKTQLNRQVKGALGADIFVSDKRLKPIVENFVHNNVSLIRNMSDRLLLDIEGATMNAVQNGVLHETLAETFAQQFGIAEGRAKLIARDQIGKAYGQINASRQLAMGIASFRWRTVMDERVRSEHQDLEGETFRFDEPPTAGLPGEEIGCRCYAEPVLDELVDVLD